VASQIATLRLGARVCFDDRWQGSLSAVDLGEDGEVINITVASGFFFLSSSVRLPFSSVTSWNDQEVRIAANSFTAFAREIPPVAMAARPLSAASPTSHPSTSFAGATVRVSDRKAVEILISRGMTTYRVPIDGVAYEGKTMTISVQPGNLTRYAPDAEIIDRLRHAVSTNEWLTPADKQSLVIDVQTGVAHVAGNVRLAQTRDYVLSFVGEVPGVAAVESSLHDDHGIEAAIGRSMDKEGIQREADVFARSNLGEVTLYGAAPTAQMIEDIARAIGRVPGVRQVINHIDMRAPDRPTAPPLVAS
jgi:osmotically-inducible protein OsmY